MIKPGDRVRHNPTGETATVLEIHGDELLVEPRKGSSKWLIRYVPGMPVLWHKITVTVIT